jgi:hypothetical protein
MIGTGRHVVVLLARSQPVAVVSVVVADEEAHHRRQCQSRGRSRSKKSGGATCCAIDRCSWRHDGRCCEGRQRSSGDVRRALVALGKESKCVNLLHEVGYAGPAAEPEADHQHPRHHEGVDHVGSSPPSGELGRPFHRVLHQFKSNIICHFSEKTVGVKMEVWKLGTQKANLYE